MYFTRSLSGRVKVKIVGLNCLCNRTSRQSSLKAVKTEFQGDLASLLALLYQLINLDSYLISLSFSFLVWKMEAIIVLSQGPFVKIKWDNSSKILIVLAHSKHLVSVGYCCCPYECGCGYIYKMFCLNNYNMWHIKFGAQFLDS